MTKGDRYERQLVSQFADEGWYVQRAASSGAATSNPLPDVVAARDGVRYVCEVKFTSSSRVYVDEREIDELAWCARHLDAKPRIVARFSGDTTYYGVAPVDSERTKSGRYVVNDSRLSRAEPLPPLHSH